MEEEGRHRSEGTIHKGQLHSRASREGGQQWPPLPLAFAALRAGLEGSWWPLGGSHAGSGWCALQTRGDLFCEGGSTGLGEIASAGSNEFHLL